MSHWQTKDELKERVHDWARKLEIQVSVISMRAMRNKWASYTRTTGLLIFNSELLEMDKDLSEYVIVHELLHFRAPNHGKLWKSLMRAYLGDYEELEKRLNERGNHPRAEAKGPRALQSGA
ncbi:MAG: M48 family metallopeptidase [Chloroflexi bacterium]|nr:M48 family metallopeptidase [Chloroflexota bacterium]